MDLIGKTFGKLTVIDHGSRIRERIAWLCRCECGGTKQVATYDLTHGIVQSCGCLRRDDDRYKSTIDYLERYPLSTAREISDYLKIPQSSICNVLSILENKGKIERVKDGVYRWRICKPKEEQLLEKAYNAFLYGGHNGTLHTL